MGQHAAHFFKHLITPRSREDDLRRREFIFYALLLPAIGLFFVGFVFGFYRYLFQTTYSGLTPLTLFMLLSYFVALYTIARAGHVRFAATVFIASFFLLPTYAAYRWGVDLPASVLFYALLIVMAGVLISARSGFFMMFAVLASIVAIAYAHHAGIAAADRSWVDMQWGPLDILAASVLFCIMATVSWLSNREIEKSLQRARASERDLKKERDLLEIRIEERTQELKRAQMEKMTQAYRFVEFGRIASGFFHDLISPLTALSINLETIGHTHQKGSVSLDKIAENVELAKRTTEHMQDLMASMRKHLSHEEAASHFSLSSAIRDLVPIFESYARARSITIRATVRDEVRLFGDPTHFTQVMTNLISNAIDAYPAADSSAPRRVVDVELSRRNDHVEISVTDQGIGISEENIQKIFEPFFSTKENGRGLGIGLALTKRIVEKEFGGTLSVVSAPGKGSRFVVSLPIREP